LHLAHLRGVGPTRVPKRAFPFDGSEVVLPFMNGPDPRTRARPRSCSAGPGARCTAATIAAAGAIAAVSAGAIAPVAPRRRRTRSPTPGRAAAPARRRAGLLAAVVVPTPDRQHQRPHNAYGPKARHPQHRVTISLLSAA